MIVPLLESALRDDLQAVDRLCASLKGTSRNILPLCVDLATRANPRSSFYFLIPGQYTYHRDLTFRATVTPQVGPLLPGQCVGCQGNQFTLNAVPFKQAATVTKEAGGELAWPALLRKLDRIDPSYRH